MQVQTKGQKTCGQRLTFGPTTSAAKSYQASRACCTESSAFGQLIAICLPLAAKRNAFSRVSPPPIAAHVSFANRDFGTSQRGQERGFRGGWNKSLTLISIFAFFAQLLRALEVANRRQSFYAFCLCFSFFIIFLFFCAESQTFVRVFCALFLISSLYAT